MKQAGVHYGPKAVVNPLYLFFCIFATISCFVFLVYHGTMLFETSDEPIKVMHLTPAKRKEFGGNPITVDVGLSVNHFRKFNMNANDFEFEGVLTLAFDPALISLQTVEQVSFMMGEILYKSAPSTYVWHGKMYAHYNILVRFSNYINYTLFPIDDHTLSLLLINKYVSPAEIIFEAKNDDFVVSQDISFIGWHKMGQSVDAGYVEDRLDVDPKDSLYYPAAVFSIDYGRQESLRNTLIIILPMALLFFVSLFSIILDPKENYTLVVTIPVQTIAGLIAFRFVVESLSPQVGYFMYSDYCFFMFLTLMFSILLFHTFGYQAGSLIRKIFIALLCGIAVTVFVFLLWF